MRISTEGDPENVTEWMWMIVLYYCFSTSAVYFCHLCTSTYFSPIGTIKIFSS